VGDTPIASKCADDDRLHQIDDVGAPGGGGGTTTGGPRRRHDAVGPLGAEGIEDLIMDLEIDPEHPEYPPT
jgi:hypothetical protein